MVKKVLPISWMITGSLCIFVIFQFFLQGSIGIMSSEIKESFQIDAASMSILSSSFFYSYILLQIPAGIILDRFGLRYVIVIALCLLGFGSFVFAFSHNFQVAIYTRIVMGCGACFAFLGMLKSISTYFPKEQFTFLMSLCECAGMFGVAMLNAFMSKLTTVVGWRYSMYFCAFLAFAVAYLLKKIFDKEQRLIGKRSEDMSAISEEESVGRKNVKKMDYVKKVFLTKVVWLNGIYAGCVYSIVTVFVALWGIPFVTHAYQVDVITATSMVSCVYIGIALFSPILGWITRYMSIIFLMQIGAGLSFVSILSFLYLPPFSVWFAYVMMFLLGVFCSVYQLAFALVSRSIDPDMHGVSSGLTNMLCMSGAPILQPIIGIALSLTQQGVFDGYEIYTADEYRKALLVLPVFLAISFLLSVCMRHGFEKKSVVASD